MRTEDFISTISNLSKEDDKFESLRKGVPLGLDEGGNVVYASQYKSLNVLKNLCVTGEYRVEFICRTLITLSCLYDREEANFILISPNQCYAEVLRLNNMDATVPFIRMKSDLELVKKAIQDILIMRMNGAGYPRLIIVLDGLEELPECNKNKEFLEYREFFNMLMQRWDVEVICGVDLMKSIFSGCPGGFIGIGNCLVTALEQGRADVTYVGNDASLSQPMPITYPDAPSLEESITLLNALGKNGGV